MALKRRDAFKRSTLVLEFDVYRGDYAQGIVLARIPMFLRLPGAAGVSPHSKLARLFHDCQRVSERLAEMDDADFEAIRPLLDHPQVMEFFLALDQRKQLGGVVRAPGDMRRVVGTRCF